MCRKLVELIKDVPVQDARHICARLIEHSISITESSRYACVCVCARVCICMYVCKRTHTHCTQEKYTHAHMHEHEHAYTQLRPAAHTYSHAHAQNTCVYVIAMLTFLHSVLVFSWRRIRTRSCLSITSPIPARWITPPLWRSLCNERDICHLVASRGRRRKLSPFCLVDLRFFRKFTSATPSHTHSYKFYTISFYFSLIFQFAQHYNWVI